MMDDDDNDICQQNLST